MKKNLVKFIAGIIIAIAVILAIASVWNDSLIVDEVPHIGAAYSYVTEGDMRLNPEHPPLAKDLAGLSLKFFLPHLNQSAFQTDFWQTKINGQWDFGRHLIFNSGNDADLITHVAKLPMLIFFILSAVLTFHWASKLYGQKAGLLALFLFAFSPTVLTHSRFVTTDLPALFGVLTASYFFLNYLQNPSPRNFWLAGLIFGVALLAKFSVFLLVPYFFLLALIWGWLKRYSVSSVFYFLFTTFLILAVGFTLVVWPVYYFHTWHYPPAKQHTDTANLLQSFGKRYLAEPVVWASDKPILRAAAHYGLGLLMTVQRSTGGNTTYFLGKTSRFGWRSYFPIVYFIKEPLAWWGLAIMALITIVIQSSFSYDRRKMMTGWLKNHFVEFAMLLWLTIYWASSIRSILNIGVRHLLPTYPFAIILVSGAITKTGYKLYALGYRSKKFTAYYSLLTALLGWYLFENLLVFPHYLTYFNQTVGGPSGGYRYVVDSNLDWGQDLSRFARWVEENDIPKIELSYFGWADPFYYLGDRYIYVNQEKYVNADDFRALNQSNGWLAVSATFLQGSEGLPDQPKSLNWLWLKNFQPVTVIGNSIFVYRIQ